MADQFAPRSITEDEIEHRFSYHKPNQLKVERHEHFREACKMLAMEIKDMVPAGREQSLAITHLEDVMMWGNAGIARNG